jgi:putative phosphoribosyl transferase
MFRDRHEAGKKLADALKHYKGQKEAIVLGLARGGVVVAYEAAKALSLPLNVLVPRKIGAPGNHELAIGAILENGERVLNESILHSLGITEAYLKQESEKEKSNAIVRSALYRHRSPLPPLKNKTVILVDDGIATGATMFASIKAMRKEGAKKVVVAIPVASTSALEKVKVAADDVICLYDTEDFGAVGYFYDDFRQTEDEEVIEHLKAMP